MQQSRLFDAFFQGSKTCFIKANVCGNDFVIVHESLLRDCRSESLQELVVNICDRRFGVGCDQLLVIRDSEECDIGLNIYNSDGSAAMMCGNGMLCLGGLFFSQWPEEMVCDIGIFEGSVYKRSVSCDRVGEGRARASIGCFRIRRIDDFRSFVDVGNLHDVVVARDHFASAIEFFSKCEPWSLPPQGVNSSRVAVIEKDKRIAVLTFESGSGETLCCGSAACASAASVLRNPVVGSLYKVEFETKGSLKLGEVPFAEVVFSGDDEGHVALVGGYRVSYRGSLGCLGDKNGQAMLL